jgi:hypothetical protein
MQIIVTNKEIWLLCKNKTKVLRKRSMILVILCTHKGINNKCYVLNLYKCVYVIS